MGFSPSRRPMRTIAVLSRKRDLYATRRLLDEVRLAGCEGLVIDPLEVPLMAGGSPIPDVLQRRWKTLLGTGRLPDAVIPRIGASITEEGISALSVLTSLGCIPLNRAEAIEKSRDKFRAAVELSRVGIPVPETLLLPGKSASASSHSHAAHTAPHTLKIPELRPAEIAEALGGLPVVVKFVRGTQGVGVMLARTMPELASLMRTFASQGQRILFQRFVAESKGRDIRAFVAGGEVVGAMRRSPLRGDFRANVHRGGKAECADLDADERNLALRSARVLGLEAAGVDLIESKEGPLVIEVNSSPGFEALEHATGKNAARAVVKCALRLCEERTKENSEEPKP